MKRSTLAAGLIIVGLLGSGGGAYAAFVAHSGTAGPSGGPSSHTTGDASDSRSGSPEPSTGASSDSSTATGDDLFYYADKTIHDGDRTVPVKLSRSDDVSSLQRLGDGWLIAQLHSEGGEQELYYGTIVNADGSTWDLGLLGQEWDIDSDGRVLYETDTAWGAADPSSHTITPIDPSRTADQIDAMSGTPQPWIQSAGNGILTGWDAGDGTRMVLSDDNSNTEVGPMNVSVPTTNNRGDLAVGEVIQRPSGQPDKACLSGGPLTTEQWWQNCDFRRLSRTSAYAPDGNRILAIPAESDGYGPGLFSVVDARTGEELQSIKAPQWTTNAAWGADSSLIALVRPDGSDRSIIYRGGLDGKWHKVKKLTGQVTLGDI